ncbi:MAG: HNH endonuclease [Gaiellaceae bacterium MAG52_C11]|nr:HNH endonuclease [Candidatus Gaiellasilicea maunaloa]
MKIDWWDKRCIVCVRQRDTGQEGRQTTRGHVIPESIGGRLWSPFLCKDCNSKMGTLEDKLLGDVSVIGVVEQLLPELPPKVGLNIHSRAGYFRDDEQHGRLYAKPRRDDGGLELSTMDEKTRRDEDVRAEVRKKLRAASVADDQIKAKLAEYDAASPGQEFEIVPGERVRKPISVAGQAFSRTWDEPIVPAVVPLGIAYLFLACCIREEIYEARFDAVREVLLQTIGGAADAASKWTIDWLRTPDVPVAALHGLAFEEVGGEATVRVVIFRWLVWRVHFPMLEPPMKRTHYSRYLETGDEDANLGHIVRA